MTIKNDVQAMVECIGSRDVNLLTEKLTYTRAQIQRALRDIPVSDIIEQVYLDPGIMDTPDSALKPSKMKGRKTPDKEDRYRVSYPRYIHHSHKDGKGITYRKTLLTNI